MGHQFLASVKIFLGELADHISEFEGYGRRALVVTGKSSATNGSLQDTLRILDKLGIEKKIFDRVKVNPPLESVSDCATEGIKFDADFLIAIGGGSAMDTAKAASVLIACKNTRVIAA